MRERGTGPDLALLYEEPITWGDELYAGMAGTIAAVRMTDPIWWAQSQAAVFPEPFPMTLAQDIAQKLEFTRADLPVAIESSLELTRGYSSGMSVFDGPFGDGWETQPPSGIWEGLTDEPALGAYWPSGYLRGHIQKEIF